MDKGRHYGWKHFSVFCLSKQDKEWKNINLLINVSYVHVIMNKTFIFYYLIFDPQKLGFFFTFKTNLPFWNCFKLSWKNVF